MEIQTANPAEASLDRLHEAGLLPAYDTATHRTTDGQIIVYTPTHLYHIGAGGRISATQFVADSTTLVIL